MKSLVLSTDSGIADHIISGFGSQGFFCDKIFLKKISFINDELSSLIKMYDLVVLHLDTYAKSDGNIVEKFLNSFSDKQIVILVSDHFNFIEKHRNNTKVSVKLLRPIDYIKLVFFLRNRLFLKHCDEEFVEQNMKDINHILNNNVQAEILKSETNLNVLNFKELTLDLANRCLLYNENKYFLRNKEYDLLKFFFENQGKLLTRSTILENVWDMNAELLTNTVDVHVGKLRKILLKIGVEDVCIKTIPCSGYILE